MAGAWDESSIPSATTGKSANRCRRVHETGCPISRILCEKWESWRQVLSRRHQRRALRHGDELAHLMPQINLTRPRDLLLRIGDQLLPLRQPSHRPRNRKQHGEHFRLEAHGLVNDPGIKIDVGIKLALDEVVVLERDAL